MAKSEITVRVLVADSQYLITESLKSILSEAGSFIITGVVTDKDEIVRELNISGSDLLIIDPFLIDLNNISELKEIKKAFPDLKLVVLTNVINKTELYELNNIGINNIILKTADKEEISDALNAAINRKKYYSNELLNLLFEINDKPFAHEESVLLTPSEMEIVRLISDGLTTKEIAAHKFISFHTVITHRKNIFRKLGVSSISELIMYALKSGWINLVEYHI